jgi:oxalate decarboxylase/phosphoglucose isomerase-like protein (cupin superfamily)
MDSRFNDIFSQPQNSVFKVVFFPDRVYHDYSLSATRSDRYRYNVQEVRNALDMGVMKGQVYLDGVLLSNMVRVEYRGGRLIERVREKGRYVKDELIAWMKLLPDDQAKVAEATVHLHYDPRIDAYYVELWQTLEPPEGNHHDFRVLDLMGHENAITRIPAFLPAMEDLHLLKRVDLAFREDEVQVPRGYRIPVDDVAWDNDYLRSHEAPNTQNPSDSHNTVQDSNYELSFQRDFLADATQVQPVRYRNPMMEQGNPDASDTNIIEMRWLFQRELGGSLVFFHEVTVPPGAVEGTHQHIGTEELYYIVAGEGLAYVGEGDAEGTDNFKVVDRWIYGLGPHPCREVPVKAGSVIFTKSGGIHGIRNPGTAALKFVAFLYHTF